MLVHEKKYTVRHHYYRIACVASLAFDMLVIAYGGTPSDISYRFSSIDASALRLTGIWFCKIFLWVLFDLCHVQEMINMSLLVPIGMIMFDGSVLYKDWYDKLRNQKPCTLEYRQVSNIRRTLPGNEIVDHSDVVGASPVGAAPITSSFST